MHMGPHVFKLSKRRVKSRPTKSPAGCKCPSAASAAFFLTVPSGLFVLASVLLCLLGVNVLLYLSHNSGTGHCHEVGWLPQRCIPINILFDVRVHVRIPVVIREESYTSQASAVGRDDIPTYGEEKGRTYDFSGKRIRRGLYRTKAGTLLNADINGAANTIRKEYPEAFPKP